MRPDFFLMMEEGFLFRHELSLVPWRQLFAGFADEEIGDVTEVFELPYIDRPKRVKEAPKVDIYELPRKLSKEEILEMKYRDGILKRPDEITEEANGNNKINGE